MSEKMSVTDAAKRLGISRPRLSKLVDDHGLQKTVDGKRMLVDVTEVQALLSRLASEHKIRTPPVSKKKPQTDVGLAEHYKDELRRVSQERDELADKVRALEGFQNEVKLLKAAEEQKSQAIEALTTKVELLESQLEKETRAKVEKYEKVKGSLVGRLLGL